MSGCEHSDELVELMSLTIQTSGFGTTVYRNQMGEIHRVHGPAIIYTDGDTRWVQKGLLHRTDGPAVVSENGTKMAWYLDGRRHRIDGPAMMDAVNGLGWFLDDIEISEKEFNERIKHTK